MLKMVDGTGIIGVDMICPLGISTPQPPNYDRVELEGTGMLVLPNSLDAPLERLELGGKTEQVQTTGAQLFDIAKCPLEHNGISFKIPKSSGDVVLMDGYVFEENTQYTISAQKVTSENGNSASFKFEYVDGGRSEILVKDMAKKSLTSTNGKTVKRFLATNSYGAVQEVFNFQLEKGSTVTPYEPYTGGKPSPSPEYPQEIKSVGKWNEEKQKYEVDVKVTGKNLFDIEKAKEKSNWTTSANGAGFAEIAVYVGTGSTVTVSNNTKINNPGLYYYGVALKSSEDFKYFICYPGYPNSKDTHTFTATEDYIYVRCNKTSLNEVIGVCGGLQIEIGASRTDFESYKEQTLTLTSDRPITKWDKLVEQGGEIGWLYGSVIATIDETASISLYVPNGFYVYVKNIDKKEKTGYCDKLYAKRMSNGEPFVLFGNANNNVLYTLNTQEFYGKTVSEIKEKLKEYPLNIIGKSETTEFVPLPQSEQNAIRALKTYYPTTVITVDGGELDPDIKVTYRKEI